MVDPDRMTEEEEIRLIMEAQTYLDEIAKRYPATLGHAARLHASRRKIVRMKTPAASAPATADT
jgi:hypothetical protein